MKMIVAVDTNWAIGYKGELLERIPEDMRFFKEMTTGKVVVMGRETFNSLPNQAPLKDRVNIVLTRDETFHNENVIVCRSLPELFSHLDRYPPEDIFVIGGESIYCQLLKYCTEAYVTKMDNSYVADKYFVDLDKESNWRLVSKSEKKTFNGIDYWFLKYTNCCPVPYKSESGEA